ncbi:hypothetical protein RYX45_01295 [Alkalihalophilus pseudofirmus]|uniref:Uncharacterized protein n=1 Tax=Alkalihalophilus pseudofirmus TaxID=79885 RepID=A0AAJ2KS02_ALKPS|nr:hypothetical protein [Alkalihalophilus pseudofirmus]MDV2883797.1 hypothetical protein [Alkalihalophilus pseudofirmus]
MLAKQVLAAMPKQESVEQIIERLNARIFDRARDNFTHMTIDATDFVGFFLYKDKIAKYYRNEGFHVQDLDGTELLVTW